MPPSGIELLDDLLKDYNKPEDMLGQDVVLEQLTKPMSSALSTANLLINTLREVRLISEDSTYTGSLEPPKNGSSSRTSCG